MIKKGFTLAEVLVTIGIIGIIAAMTIPQLHNRTKNSHLGAQFANAVSTLENGIGTYLYDHNVKDVTQLVEGDEAAKTITQLLAELQNNYIRMRSYSGNKPCTGAAYLLPDKSVIGVCADTALTVHTGSAEHEMFFLSSKSTKQSNFIEGLDYFKMSLSANGLIYVPGSDYDTASATCSRLSGGRGCVGRVANNGWKFDESVYTD